MGGGRGEWARTGGHPTNIGILVSTLVVVSDGVDIWVATRFSYR